MPTSYRFVILVDFSHHKKDLDQLGFSIVPKVFSSDVIEKVVESIDKHDHTDPSFLRSKDLFAIRELFLRIPALLDLILTHEMKELLSAHGLSEHSITKAIYFDKPSSSNWFVAYHQDLIINVDQKIDVAGYSNWTNKRGLIGVQPPLEILQNTTTLRIHLDDADESNGALRVLPHSHLNGIQRTDRPFDTKAEVCCTIKKGGVMLMKPLTMHASHRATSDKRRRVIHIEFCDQELAFPLSWKEKPQ